MVELGHEAARTRLTERDLEIARWVERVGIAEAEQVARRFSLWPSKTYGRLRALSARGLVVHERVFYGRPGVYRPPGRRVRPALYEHELAVTDLTIERELSGERTLTERELRRAGAAWSVGRDGSRHTPDLAVPEAATAYEVERSSKGARRRRRILAAYAQSPTYDRVVYRVFDPRLAELIEREADDEGAGALVVVEIEREERAA